MAMIFHKIYNDHSILYELKELFILYTMSFECRLMIMNIKYTYAMLVICKRLSNAPMCLYFIFFLYNIH